MLKEKELMNENIRRQVNEQIETIRDREREIESLNKKKIQDEREIEL